MTNETIIKVYSHDYTVQKDNFITFITKKIITSNNQQNRKKKLYIHIQI
jgi:hypothetical protein